MTTIVTYGDSDNRKITALLEIIYPNSDTYIVRAKEDPLLKDFRRVFMNIDTEQLFIAYDNFETVNGFEAIPNTWNLGNGYDILYVNCYWIDYLSTSRGSSPGRTTVKSAAGCSYVLLSKRAYKTLGTLVAKNSTHLSDAIGSLIKGRDESFLAETFDVFPIIPRYSPRLTSITGAKYSIRPPIGKREDGTLIAMFGAFLTATLILFIYVANKFAKN